MQNITNIELKTKASRTYFAIKTSKKWGILGNNDSKLPLLSSTHFPDNFRDNFQQLTKYVAKAFIQPLKSASEIDKDDFTNQFDVVALNIERDVNSETGVATMTISIKCLYESSKFETPIEISIPKQSNASSGMFMLPVEVETLVNSICEDAWTVVSQIGIEYERDLFSN